MNITPIEIYSVKGRNIYVKREDLCCPQGWPPFSKMRGLWSYLSRRQQEGLTVVGYTETSISMAGWGVCQVAKEVGMKAVIFDPQYKVDHPEHKLLEYHREQWKRLGADLIPLPAGRAKINWYQSHKILLDRYGSKAELLPLGIPLKETVEETAKEWQMASIFHNWSATICCVGSGTIFAGLLKGWREGDGEMIGVMCRTGNLGKKEQECLRKADVSRGTLLGRHYNMSLFDPGWEYTKPSKASCPFPCHPYYDLKAWQWLVEHLDEYADPILFWNIGHSPI